ncbi:hypothetical protein AVEN_197580-1 [Araneus ventricosus]|uniref:Uncharacterized protein n=1 Tax=Araneus ventricosus TaxID=182803 RepID=A0A4Y2RAN1_ARAVE|nr:hypothetical protein AVEN_197580-1 [Araneus ventricosus]
MKTGGKSYYSPDATYARYSIESVKQKRFKRPIRLSSLYEETKHKSCVCSAKGDPNATVCPATKPFHFTKPSAENLSTWCENIVQDKRSLARLMSIMKILHERRQDIIMD